jgi:glycosyltransferase involved in cell wall biosynthesis
MYKPVVSIVIATLGDRSSIIKSIESVLNQSFSKWELIIVCSDLSILSRYKIQEDFRIRVVRQVEPGIYQNFNLGIESSKGDFISILNDDDWYESNFLELAIQTLTSTECDGVYGDTNLHSNAFGISYIIAKNNLEENLLYDFLGAYHTTFVLRKTSFEDYGLFKLQIMNNSKMKYANDYEWFVSSLLRGLKLVKNDGIKGNFSLGGASTIQRLLLIREGKEIAKHYSRNAIEKAIILIVWNMRLLRNKIK